MILFLSSMSMFHLFSFCSDSDSSDLGLHSGEAEVSWHVLHLDRPTDRPSKRVTHHCWWRFRLNPPHLHLELRLWSDKMALWRKWSEYGAITVVGCRRRRGISLRNTDKPNASDINTGFVPQFNDKAGAQPQKSKFKKIIQIFGSRLQNFEFSRLSFQPPLRRHLSLLLAFHLAEPGQTRTFPPQKSMTAIGNVATCLRYVEEVQGLLNGCIMIRSTPPVILIWDATLDSTSEPGKYTFVTCIKYVSTIQHM